MSMKAQSRPGDCLCRDASRTLPRDAEQVLVAHFEGARVLPDEQGLHVSYSALDGVRLANVAALAPSGDAFVRLYLDEHPGPEARVNYESLDIGDFHC